MLEILKKLCDIPAAPGFEAQMLSFVEKEITPFCNEIFYDNMGNLIAKKEGSGKAQKIMLCTGVDSSGYIVNYIEENGYLRLTKLGNPSSVSSAYTKINIGGKVNGYILSEKGAELKNGDYSKLYADIGASSRKEAESLVKLGDICALPSELTSLYASKIGGSGLSARLGVAILIDIIKNVGESENELYFAFAVQENLMHRGAKTVAFDVDPDVCVCVDVCESFDTIGAENRGGSALGDGAVILAKGADFVSNPVLREKIENMSKEKNIKSKTCVYTGLSVINSAVCKTGKGAGGVCICVPVRNPGEMAQIFDMDDAQCAKNLVLEFIK